MNKRQIVIVCAAQFVCLCFGQKAKITEVLRPPIINRDMETDIQVIKGQPVTFICEADGFPKPTIVWKRGFGDFTGPGGYALGSGPNFTILQTKIQDRGSYVCEATNGVGEPVEKTVELGVNFAPVVTTEHQKIFQRVNSEAELTCEISAYPSVDISWIRNGKPVTNSDSIYAGIRGVTPGEHTATLIVKKVQSADFGEYSCIGENEFGKTELKFQLLSN